MVGISLRRILFWGGYAAIVAVALASYGSATLLAFDTPVGAARAVLLAVWLGFTGYSLYCIPKESLFQTAQQILGLYWGRQVTADLYISAFLSIALVWMVTGSWVETLLWGLAFIPYVNLVILLFLILHLEQIFVIFGLT